MKRIFIEYCNGTYEGEYKVSLKMPDNADKNILNSRAELIEEGKDVACILKSGNNPRKTRSCRIPSGRR
ncbi:MAG: hypothetical protein K2I96_04455 [Lachnospiraceae bacterium]|nr:hypothetical protein [Lachnospiraceae bacterium]